MSESIFLSNLGERLNNDLDLWYSYVFMYTLSQLFVPTSSSQSSIVCIKPSIQAFSHTKALGSKVDPAVK